MVSLTVENYVKAIYQVCAREGQAAGTGQLAEALGVSPGSVTSMLKTLSEGGLAVYTPYEGVRLTTAGSALALRILRRHRLIEQFLVHTLKLSWDEVHEEAEQMEHAVSDRLVDRIEAYLGFPEVDPHGDPIPRRDGSMADPARLTLAECRPGDEFRLARVVNQSPQFLRYLTDAGLSLGTAGQVLANSEEAGTITVRVGQLDKTLGRTAAEKMLVEVSGQQ